VSKTCMKESISQAVKQLGMVVEAVASVRLTGTLSEESYKFFEIAPSTFAQLSAMSDLIGARDMLLEMARVYPMATSSQSPDKFFYHTSEVSFTQGRYLLLQNYLSTVWAIYDNVSKIAGTLCCTDSLAKNPTKPVRLVEHFLKDEKGVGSRVRDHLKGGYGWPIAISYTVRNWLVHDGFTHDGVDLFASSAESMGKFIRLG
jgi:hypothetical protein